MSKITTFLTFQGQAEEAMNLYTSLFEGSEVLNIVRYGPEGPGAEGSVMHAIFSLNGQVFMCIDSNIAHAWTFTPAVSLWVTCETEQEIDTLYAELSEDGEVFMPLDAYPFSAKYAWVADRFGVSWQLSLPESTPPS
jgi:predicted 3-demethylubiquinone-9 3-methyltransferase (glyoxalase superfamily)